MADKKLAKVGITIKEPWRVDVSYETLDFTLWRVQDGGDGCGYIAKRDNIGVVPNSDDSVWIPASQAGQSIYDLAVKYHHFDGTEEEFEAEYQAVLQAARDAASETRATNTEIQAAEELRKTAENARVEAETARQTAETGRQTAETARQTAETQRGENETTRQALEASRQNAEQTRQNAEQTRQSNESTRQSNETARESAELERTADFEGLKTDMQTAIQQADAATATAVALNNQVAGDESARQQAEQSRVAAETQRQTAETQRGTNEQTRQTQETARQTAETARANAESARATAENARKTAETGRANAETARVNAETARVAAETAREEQSTSDHQRAESDHAIAAEDHATLDEKISHKADIDGSYDGMAVGIARNLEGRTDVTGSFFERTTGGDAEVANGTAQLNEVKGKSLVWNQMLDANNYPPSSTIKGISLSNNGNGSITINGTNDGSGSSVFSLYTYFQMRLTANHKYILFGSTKMGGWGVYSLYLSGPGQNYPVAGTGARIFTLSQDALLSLTLSVWSNKTVDNDTFYPQLFDLTLLGIDNLTTVEEVEAWLAENIGEQAYYPYNAGEVLNNRMTGVESIGFNLLDPATGKADIIGAYSDVYGNYYGITGTHGTLTFTDKFGNTETITPDEDGKFLLEKAGTLSVADAGEDCAVFLWWDGTQTEYKPYEKNVGALDVTHIYGKLNGEGEYVRVWPTGMPGIGDIKDSLKVVDGQVVAERKIAEVDMGTMRWGKGESSGRVIFYADPDPAGAQYQNFPVAVNKYSHALNNANDKTIRSYYVQVYSRVSIADSAYDDYTKEDFKTAMSGQLLYYELATPQVFTDLIYRDSESFADNTPVTLPVNYKVDNWGIERIAPQNTEETVVTTKPELTMRYSIDAVEELNTHRDEIDDLYEKNEELDQRKPEKYGEYPDMAVGSAKTLAGQDTKVEDFFFKPIDCADGLAKLNSARGKSWAWNQMVKDYTQSDNLRANGGSTIAYQDGKIKITFAGATSNHSIGIKTQGFILGHRYLLKMVYGGVTPNLLKLGSQLSVGSSGDTIGFTSGIIRTQTTNTGENGTVWMWGTEGDMEISSFKIVDLTLMFGAGNEPATVEEFEAMFPLPYYDYNAGEIISNKATALEAVGFNQWDEEFEEGDISSSTGANISATTTWRTKNYIPVLPETQYYIKATLVGVSTAARGRFYDADKNYIGYSPYEGGDVNCNAVFKTPRNARYMRFAPNKSVVPSSVGVCLNLSDPARNGEYEPYKTNTIELNLPTLTGKLNGEGESVVVFPDGLKSVGSVYDEIVGDKAIKRVGVVDLGTLTWEYQSNYIRYRAPFTGAVVPPDQSAVPNCLCAEYTPVSMGRTRRDLDNTIDKVVSPGATGYNYMYAVNSAYTDAATFKSAMSGVLLYYELATPEEYILDAPLPDTFQAYKGGTIKQLPENTSVPTTAPMVMTVTYAIDAVGTLVGLPRNYVSKESLQAMLNAMQSAGIIASYTMTYNENTGKYDFTFVAPTNS